MPCNSPVEAYRAPHGGISFGKDGYRDLPVLLPCGGCVGCRLDRSMAWAMRCMHEAQSHEHCCFLTLTYDEASAPPGGTLVMKHLQDFWKRLRKSIAPQLIKYFAVGEYGEQLLRPHYHALVFGHDFTDKVLHTRRAGYVLHRSPALERLWPHGFSTVGALTFETAAYCSRYCLKKITGDLAGHHYGDLKPEFMTCSKGIGLAWFNKFKRDVYPHDYVVARGKTRKVPRYYDKQLDDDELAQIKRARVKNAERKTAKQMMDREELAIARFATAARNLA